MENNLQVNTRSNKRKLKRWVRRSVAVLAVLGIMFGAYKTGVYALKVFFGTPVVGYEGKALDQVREDRLNGERVSLTWDESETIQVMHKMTHQKIKASEKWGAVQMTPERVKELINHVVNSDFENRIELLDILGKWDRKDFSEADLDHNALWNMQGGTVGKAKGILSPADEKDFIKEVFGEEN